MKSLLYILTHPKKTLEWAQLMLDIQEMSTPMTKAQIEAQEEAPNYWEYSDSIWISPRFYYQTDDR